MKLIQLHTNEKQLIKRAQKNDRHAQQCIYDQHAAKMLSVCRQYVKDIQYAEEVLNTGFLKVFTYLKSFKHAGSFEGWIRKIMVRESISFLRSNKALRFWDEEVEDHAGISESPVMSSDTDYIQRCIDELPQGYKTVFLMYAVEGYKHHEIATLLEIKESTSKSQLFKARNMLQQKLNAQKNSEHGIK
ncbi:RNA polymerase sigma factor [Gangjinia marincola]|uniref:RNA polymerase sigma factor n=1 Tax=Gangjinia marincola TaxID=578463 RepID=A0ABP3XVA9_9FLAO